MPTNSSSIVMDDKLKKEAPTTITATAPMIASPAPQKRWQLDDDKTCDCERCCCHTRVLKKGLICKRCGEECMGYLLLSGGAEWVEKKGGRGEDGSFGLGY